MNIIIWYKSCQKKTVNKQKDEKYLDCAHINLIIDNIFNTNALIKYWRTQWLPEEYIIDYVYCEDYSCEIGDLNE